MRNRTSPGFRSTRLLFLFVVCPLVLSGCPQLLCDFGVSDLCEETYTVTYSPNGADEGSVPVDGSEHQEGDTVTVLSNSGGLARSGYGFDGWNTAINGAGTSYSAGATFAMGSANVTLYAVWSPNPTNTGTYTVTYNPNSASSGSAPTDSTAYQNGATVTVLGNTGSLARSGYTFASWNTAANGSGTSYTTGSTFAMGASNVTLYAEWSSDQSYSWSSIVYDQYGATIANGGSYLNDNNYNTHVIIGGGTPAHGVNHGNDIPVRIVISFSAPSSFNSIKIVTDWHSKRPATGRVYVVNPSSKTSTLIT